MHFHTQVNVLSRPLELLLGSSLGQGLDLVGPFEGMTALEQVRSGGRAGGRAPGSGLRLGLGLGLAAAAWLGLGLAGHGAVVCAPATATGLHGPAIPARAGASRRRTTHHRHGRCCEVRNVRTGTCPCGSLAVAAGRGVGPGWDLPGLRPRGCAAGSDPHLHPPHPSGFHDAVGGARAPAQPSASSPGQARPGHSPRCMFLPLPPPPRLPLRSAAAALLRTHPSPPLGPPPPPNPSLPSAHASPSLRPCPPLPSPPPPQDLVCQDKAAPRSLFDVQDKSTRILTHVSAYGPGAAHPLPQGPGVPGRGGRAV